VPFGAATEKSHVHVVKSTSQTKPCSDSDTEDGGCCPGLVTTLPTSPRHRPNGGLAASPWTTAEVRWRGRRQRNSSRSSLPASTRRGWRRVLDGGWSRAKHTDDCCAELSVLLQEERPLAAASLARSLERFDSSTKLQGLSTATPRQVLQTK
jgi:hypothetical protein